MGDLPFDSWSQRVLRPLGLQARPPQEPGDVSAEERSPHQAEQPEPPDDGSSVQTASFGNVGCQSAHSMNGTVDHPVQHRPDVAGFLV